MRLLVVIGSTRPGRVGASVGRWFTELAAQHDGVEVEVADLAEVGLPLLDEPEHPRFGNYAHEHTRRWSATVDAADAVVIVTPEYNHGMPAPLKNALDYLHREWAFKPVAFVSYGGVSGGTRAVQMIKQVIGALRMVPVASAVTIPFVAGALDDHGHFSGGEQHAAAARAMLDELAELDRTLAPLRSPAIAA